MRQVASLKGRGPTVEETRVGLEETRVRQVLEPSPVVATTKAPSEDIRQLVEQ